MIVYRYAMPLYRVGEGAEMGMGKVNVGFLSNMSITLSCLNSFTCILEGKQFS